jgi:hypothetical protein
MSGRTRFQSQILLQLSRLARWCSGLARSYSCRRKGLHRSVRLRSNTCTSTTRFRKFRGTEFRALGQDSRFESSFANSDPSCVAVYPRDCRSRRVPCRSSQSLHSLNAYAFVQLRRGKQDKRHPSPGNQKSIRPIGSFRRGSLPKLADLRAGLDLNF